jgi:hypothetical protein
MACLLLVNVFGQGVLNMLSRFGFAPQLWPGFSPYEMSKLLLDPQYFEQIRVVSWPYAWRVSAMDTGLAWRTIFSVTSLFAYTLMATLLIRRVLRRFEFVAGRARRSMIPPSITPKISPAAKEIQLVS